MKKAKFTYAIFEPAIQDFYLKFHDSLQYANNLEYTGTDVVSVIKFNKALDNEREVYFEAKNKILQKYGELAEDKTTFVFNDKSQEPEMNKEMESLINTQFEVEVNEIDLSAYDNLKIVPAKLFPLMQIFKI